MLLALALIFLPIIFDGNGSYQPPVTSRIPETPVIPVPQQPEPSRPPILSERADTGQASVTGTEAPATEEEREPSAEQREPSAGQSEPSVAQNEPSAPSQPVSGADTGQTPQPLQAFNRELPELDSETGLPLAWSVRLGSFADRSNAINLTQRLQQAGYKAYSREMENDQGVLTIVFVGPWLDRDLADNYLQRLETEFELSGMVVEYEMQQL